MTTLGDLAEQVIADLNQATTNQERTGTFVDWSRNDANAIVGVQLSDISSDLTNSRVELSTGEIVHVSSYSLDGGTATCPPWFRAQMGTVANDTVTANTRVIVDPRWPRHQVAQKLIEGIYAITEDLFAVGEVDLSTAPLASSYELPTDCLSVLNVTLETIGGVQRHMPLRAWSLDTKNSDDKVWLRVEPMGLAGWTMRVTYRKAPVIPVASSLSTTWTSTGLPDSASDLPGLYAKAALILSPEAARTQQSSVEQGERSRSLQGWSATASSRRWQEIFDRRLHDERRKLRDRFPVRPHRELTS
jgi:hypothetical protein